jgi:hypothetical protein
MNTKEPLTVTIAGRCWTIVDSDEPLFAAGKPMDAMCDHRACEIRLDPGVSPARRQRVILDAVGDAWRHATDPTTPAVITDDPRVRRFLAWLREIQINTQDRDVVVDPEDGGLLCPMGTTVREMLDAAEKLAYPGAEAPEREALPEGERVTARDMLAVEWALLAPGWPMPEFPDGVEFRDPPAPGHPPMVWAKGSFRTTYCPCCAKPYRDAGAFRRHMAKVHGWESDGCRPPKRRDVGKGEAA